MKDTELRALIEVLRKENTVNWMAIQLKEVLSEEELALLIERLSV